MNRCTFTQTTKFTSLILSDDKHFEQIQCENMTEEQFDEYGRAYCQEHRIKVDEINKSRHKNCINKEKLINYLNNDLYQVSNAQFLYIKSLIKCIKNGDFDYE
ncbi:hypothetical protein [Spiroplasma endosymbiont of Colias croceus]|uniref:hypothetical protein n=1 Tax=Spiroplasma endosymbiont of Colias croceus TaxID=3066310 RepID=UPI0030D37CB0